MVDYLFDNYKKYPLMRIEDYVKLIYQSEFGCEHIVGTDVENRIAEECANLNVDTSEELFEQISEKYARVNLVPFVKNGYNVAVLAKMMKNVENNGTADGLEKRLGELSSVFAKLNLPYFASKRWLGKYRANGYGALHHSSTYRINYNPHYRVVEKKHAVLLPLINSIEQLLQQQNSIIVAIDGPATSGKTFYSKVLQEMYGCSVIHADDFFLSKSQRTESRFNEVGGNIDYERLEKTLSEVRSGKDFVYQRYNCFDDCYEDVNFHNTTLVVVEGVYSLHEKLRKFYDAQIVLYVNDAEQLRRLSARENAKSYRMFIEKWLPLEKTYFDSLKNFEFVDTSNITY